MRIGIDAKSFFQGPVSTRIVLQNILPELFNQFPEHEWIIFLDKKDKHRHFPYRQKNITLQYVWAKINLLSNVFVLPGIIRKLKIDTVLYQMFPPIHSSAASVAFIHDVLFRDYPSFFTWKERLYFSPMRTLTRRSNRAVATTKYVAGDLVKYGYVRDASQIDIAALGVSSYFKPVEKQNARLLNDIKSKFFLPEKYILFVGRLNVRKNIEHLLKAIPLLTDKNIPVVIVGKEDWKSPNLQSILNDEIKSRIIFTGSVSDEELAGIYALATIFCFPSYAEGFGLPPLEAMASGVPVIVSDRTALPEVCGDAAVYINPEKPESIAQAINLLLTNENTYNMKRDAGLERVKLFSWKNSAAKVMDSIMKTSNTSANNPAFTL